MTAKPWMKTWESWWTTRSHVDLDGIALAVGLRCLSLANAVGYDEAGTGWVVGPAGKPLKVSAIARESRFSNEETKGALDALVEAETMTIREDGAYGFPHARRWQESPSAGRMRTMRDVRAHPRHSDAHSDVTVTHKRLEVRGKKKEEKKKREEGSELPLPPSAPLLVFPCDKTPSKWELTIGHVRKLRTAYPALAIEIECAKAQLWIEANPAKRKTARGMMKFLMAWMSRAEKPPPSTAGGAQQRQERASRVVPDASNTLARLKNQEGKRSAPPKGINPFGGGE